MADRAEYARRDHFVGWLANQVLRLASPRYRAMIGGSILYGLRAAAAVPQDDNSECLHPDDAVMWNPYNGVTQCHACGAQPIYEAEHSDGPEEGK